MINETRPYKSDDLFNCQGTHWAGFFNQLNIFGEENLYLHQRGLFGLRSLSGPANLLPEHHPLWMAGIVESIEASR
jgi:hypothetical protein